MSNTPEITLELTVEQQRALDKFAAKHGRTWKSALRTMWFNGSDATQEDGAYLRQVRNQHAQIIDSYTPSSL